MSTRTTAICDYCGNELRLKTDGPVDDSEYAQELRIEGWTQRDDAFSDLCPQCTPGGAAAPGLPVQVSA